MKYDVDSLRMIPIAQVADSLGIPRKGNQILCPNPGHHDQHIGSVEINYTDKNGNKVNGFRCHSCGAHGDVLDMVAMKEDIPFPLKGKNFIRALERLSELSGDPGSYQMEETGEWKRKKSFPLSNEELVFLGLIPTDQEIQYPIGFSNAEMVRLDLEEQLQKQEADRKRLYYLQKQKDEESLAEYEDLAPIVCSYPKRQIMELRIQKKKEEAKQCVKQKDIINLQAASIRKEPGNILEDENLLKVKSVWTGIHKLFEEDESLFWMIVSGKAKEKVAHYKSLLQDFKDSKDQDPALQILGEMIKHDDYAVEEECFGFNLLHLIYVTKKKITEAEQLLNKINKMKTPLH